MDLTSDFESAQGLPSGPPIPGPSSPVDSTLELSSLRKGLEEIMMNTPAVKKIAWNIPAVTDDALKTARRSSISEEGVELSKSSAHGAYTS